MKKKYLKPDAEYISLEAMDIVTIIEGDEDDEDLGFDLSSLE